MPEIVNGITVPVDGDPVDLPGNLRTFAVGVGEVAVTTATEAGAAAAEAVALAPVDEQMATVGANPVSAFRGVLSATYAQVGRFYTPPRLHHRVETSLELVDEDGRLHFSDGAFGAGWYAASVNAADEVRLPTSTPTLGPTGRTGVVGNGSAADPVGWTQIPGTACPQDASGFADGFTAYMVCSWDGSTAAALGALWGPHVESGPDACRQWCAYCNQNTFDAPGAPAFHVSASGVGTLIPSDPDNHTNYDFLADAACLPRGVPVVWIVTYDYLTGELVSSINGVEHRWTNPAAHPFARGNPMSFPAGLLRDPERMMCAILHSLGGEGAHRPLNGWGGKCWILDLAEGVATAQEKGVYIREAVRAMPALRDYRTPLTADYQAGGGGYSLVADVALARRGLFGFGGPYFRDLSAVNVSPAARIVRPGGAGVALSEAAHIFRSPDIFPAVYGKRIPYGLVALKHLTSLSVEALCALTAPWVKIGIEVTRGGPDGDVSYYVTPDEYEVATDHTSGADWSAAEVFEKILTTVDGVNGYDPEQWEELDLDLSGAGTTHTYAFRNHFTNPNLGASASFWSVYDNGDGGATLARATTETGVFGPAHAEITITSVPTSRNSLGGSIVTNDALTPGTTYSFGPRLSRQPKAGQRLAVQVQFMSGAGGTGVAVGSPVSSPSVAIAANVALDLNAGELVPSVTTICPVGAVSALMRVIPSSSGVDFSVDDKLELVGALCVDKPMLPPSYAIADWAWVSGTNSSAQTKTFNEDGGAAPVVGDANDERLANGYITAIFIYDPGSDPGSTGAPTETGALRFNRLGYDTA